MSDLGYVSGGEEEEVSLLKESLVSDTGRREENKMLTKRQ